MQDSSAAAGSLQLLTNPAPVVFSHGTSYGSQPGQRPIMVVEFAAIDMSGRLLGSTTTNVLVDSGADVSMLNAELASELGLDLASMVSGTVDGVGGSTPAFEPTTPVLANLCGQWTRVAACFEEGRDPNLLVDWRG